MVRSVKQVNYELGKPVQANPPTISRISKTSCISTMELSLAPDAESLCSAAEAFGRRMTTPVESFRSVLKAACDIETASPRTRSLMRPLEEYLDALDELVAALQDRDVLFHQITLLSIAADALVWVSTDSPNECVEDATQKAAEQLSKLREMPHPSHTGFADAVDRFLGTLTEYVNDNVDGPLVFEDSVPSLS